MCSLLLTPPIQNPFIDDEAGEEEEEWDEEDYDSYTGERLQCGRPSSTHTALAGESDPSSVTPTNPSATQTDEADATENFETWLEGVRDRCTQAQATNPRGAQTVMLLRRVRCRVSEANLGFFLMLTFPWAGRHGVSTVGLRPGRR